MGTDCGVQKHCCGRGALRGSEWKIEVTGPVPQLEGDIGLDS